MSTNKALGSDNVVPLYAPNERWCFWELSEVYTGGVGLNKFVPKIGDFVVDKNTAEQYVVDSINDTNGVPVIRKLKRNNGNDIFSETDVLFGGYTAPTDTYRVYIDKTTSPYTLAVDKRCKIYGSESKYAKIFVVNKLTNESLCISQVFDNSKVLISENIQLETVAIDNHTNYSIKSVKVCNTTTELFDGDIIILVIYGEGGYVVYKRQLIVENTSFIRSVDVSVKYISSISLKSSFLSATNDTIIEFPFNINQSDLDLIGVLHYTDGSSVEVPIDGGKFSMHGIDNYIHNAVGQKSNLALAYKLDSGECSYVGVTGDGKYITKAYSLVTIQPDKTIVVKLYCIPIWNTATSKYTLDWWLFNLERNLFVNVNSFVKYTADTIGFNGSNFTTVQRLSVYINLNEASSLLKIFKYKQTVDLRLYGNPATATDFWNVKHSSNALHAAYGAGVKAKFISAGNINISSGFTTYSNWLKNIYTYLYTLKDFTIELEEVIPTHFIISFSTASLEIPVEDWNKDIAINTVSKFDTVLIRFIRKEDSKVLHLGMAAMLVK